MPSYVFAPVPIRLSLGVVAALADAAAALEFSKRLKSRSRFRWSLALRFDATRQSQPHLWPAAKR